MSNRRHALPQLEGEVFLADSGLETDLLFNRGIDLPEFAAFPLLDDADGVAVLRDYYLAHVEVAREADAGIVLETPTWRASRDWGARLDYDAAALADANRAAVDLLVALRDATDEVPVVVSGCVGPRHDAYRPEALMSAADAEEYHGEQLRTFASTDADLVTAMTLTYVAEAVGVALAAQAVGMPVVLSFTVETDGRLPDGTALGEAITAVDVATDGYPTYYMVNCAHPTHFDDVLDAGAPWADRLRGIRANASRMSHAELDEAEQLDPGDPEQLAAEYAALRRRLPAVTVVGGCCGTDVRHVAAIADAVLG